MTGWQSSRRRGPDGRRGTRRQGETAGDDPLNPDVVPGPPEDELGDPVSAARGICLRALTGAPKTRSQLADLLAARDIPDDAAETVLDRFTEVGLIDDAAFARAWVSSRQAGRGLARRALSAELRRQGRRRRGGGGGGRGGRRRRRAGRRPATRRPPGARDAPAGPRHGHPAARGMLARKGYSGGLAAAVVREALDGVDGTTPAIPDDDGLDALDEDRSASLTAGLPLTAVRSGGVGVPRSLPRSGLAVRPGCPCRACGPCPRAPRPAGAPAGAGSAPRRRAAPTGSSGSPRSCAAAAATTSPTPASSRDPRDRRGARASRTSTTSPR